MWSLCTYLINTKLQSVIVRIALALQLIIANNIIIIIVVVVVIIIDEWRVLGRTWPLVLHKSMPLGTVLRIIAFLPRGEA